MTILEMSLKLTCDLNLNQFSNQQLINLQNQLTRVIKKRLTKQEPDQVRFKLNLFLKNESLLKKDSLSSMFDSIRQESTVESDCSPIQQSDLDRALDEIISERPLDYTDQMEYESSEDHQPQPTKEQLDHELDKIVQERESYFDNF